MKHALLLCASLFTQLAQSQPELTPQQIDHWLERDHFRQIQSQITTLPQYSQDPALQLAHAKALTGLSKTEEAVTLLEKATAQFPQDPALLHLAAQQQFALAQQASIFSAPGHAKAGLKLLKQAHQLAPDDAAITTYLVGFYLQAPGIAGGDEAEAKKLAAAQQGETAVLTQTMVLNADEKTTEALQLLDSALAKTPQSARLLSQKAGLLTSQKQYAAAFAQYQQAAAAAEKPKQKMEYLYQLGRLAALEQQDKTIGKQALTEFISFYQDGDNVQLPWARVRLAQIHLAEQNKAAAEQALQPVLALADKPEKLSKELKNLQKALQKLKS